MLAISRLDKNNILARPSDPLEEKQILSGTYEWSRSERAYLLPRPRIVELVDFAKKNLLECEYPTEMYQLEKIEKVVYESTLTALRAQRQTGCRAEDIDYFRDHFNGRLTPYRHQLVTFQYVTLLGRVAIYNEMGTGKSASVCWAIEDLLIQKKIYSCLVIAPNNVLQNWEKELAIHTPRLKAVVLQGTRNERLDLLDMIADVYIVNYEGIKVLGDEIRHRFQMVVLDEAHKIKDPSASQTKLIHDLFSTVQFKVAMTGTPIGNNLLDLHQLMTWIDPFMFEPYHIFRAHWFYAVGFKWYPKSGTEKMMQEKVYTRAVRYKKEECLDLPPKTYITRTCKLNEVQAAAYKQMLKAFMMMMEEGLINAKNVLSQIMKLSEITSGFVRDENGFDHVFKKCAKLDLLEEVLEEIGPNEKVVIWARFIPDIKRIGKLLGEKAVLLYGATASGGRALGIVDRFMKDPEIRYLVGNPAVGGLGLNMTVASYAVYYSNDYSWIKRSQSEDRIHRMGSEAHNKITIMDLVCEKTIDEVVVNALVGKKELARVIIDTYRAGIADSFGLLKERKDAEDAIIKAAKNLTDITEILNFGKPEYSGVFELSEPECQTCHSKNIRPISEEFDSGMECGDCHALYE